ncbi:ABC transporter ATP-binding protein [Rhizobium sp. NZLR1b]|uniref:ABC transporter ATP-binding protein n=1 Tax=Rhizobium sp. NZLR1b TaxID=2731099 RepID=UPI001C829CFC|nr:ABC transporter ATP-binding protein [Rhizobium sp. NZLR1b]MBX5173519.1 ABC transporter ATP-binding protein [Rhizobium sp. NZLR1b]
MPLLELKSVSAGYAGANVLSKVNLSLDAGEIVTLVGSNGAGKSTIAKVISGILSPMQGEVLFDGKAIKGLSASERLRLGVAHVPEGRQIFGGMTVLENLRLGAYSVPSRRARDIESQLAFVCTFFPVMKDRLDDVAGNLSGGQQQMLAIARGLMSRPRLLILDEPSLGVAPLLVNEIFQLIQRLRGEGITILLVEQNARKALSIADRGYVIENGQIVMSGAAFMLAGSADIAERYLGIGTSIGANVDKDARMAKELLRIIA